jgi:hypothetical protein
MLYPFDADGGAAMKATVYSILAIIMMVIMLALPTTALAHDHEHGHHWHHDHGNHYGWYRHRSYWRHHDDGWYEPRYGYLGYRGNTVCDYYGDRCWSTAPVNPMWGYGGYVPMTYSGSSNQTDDRPTANGI